MPFCANRRYYFSYATNVRSFTVYLHKLIMLPSLLNVGNIFYLHSTESPGEKVTMSLLFFSVLFDTQH